MTKWHVIILWVPGASPEIVAECRAPKVSGGLSRPPPPTVARSLMTVTEDGYGTGRVPLIPPADEVVKPIMPNDKT